MMKILITGCSGFIGFHLVKALLQSGNKITGIDNLNNYYSVALKKYRLSLLKNPNFKFHKLDLHDIDKLTGEFDIAINLAAQPGVRVKKENQKLYRDTNILGFKKFCNYCLNQNIKKIIYASSSSVYQNSTNKFNELDTVLNPISEYGKSKLANEKLATKLSLKHDLSFIGLRFFSVYGPLGRPDMAYYKFTDQLYKSKEIYLHNNGKMMRDLTFIDDIVFGITQAIELIKEDYHFKNEIFNLGNDRPVETAELLKILEKKTKKKALYRNKRTFNEVGITHADISKSRDLLGYNPKFILNDGIDLFLDWYKKYEKI